jgi:SHS2 domain-containing protein
MCSSTRTSLQHEPTHRFVEHVGEVEVELSASSDSGIFAAALDAFAELLLPDGRGEPVLQEIELEGGDRTLLLVDWLNELLFLAEVEQFVPLRILSIELSGGRLRATVAGRRGTVRPLVKGIALNGLRFEREGGVWHGRVVFDV